MSYLVKILLILMITMKACFADGYLFISPQNLHLNDDKRIGQLNLVNKSKVKKTFRVVLKDYFMNENGKLIEKPFDHSAKKILRFAPRRITLEPNESQYVNISAKMGKLKDNQEYHVHAEFIEVENAHVDQSKAKNGNKDKGLALSVGAAYGVAVPVFVTKGEPKVKVEFNDFTFDKNDSKSGIANISLNRSGDKTGYVKAAFSYEAPDGKKVPIGVPAKLKVYREADQVTHSLRVSAPDKVSFSSGHIAVKVFDSHDDDVAQVIGTKKYKL